MSQPSVPLSMLLTKDVAYEWHDGVALVAQLVAQVQADIPAAQGRIPDLRAVTLEENGTLALSAHPDHSMPAMPGAAQMLQQLLSGKDQPAPLRLFGMQAATAEPVPTLDHFAEELAKWERPGRQAKLAALYFRALQQIGPEALTEEARAREDRAQQAMKERQAPEATAKAAKKPRKTTAPKDGSRQSHATAIGLLVIVAAIAVGGGAWYVLRQRGAVLRQPPTTVAAPVEVPPAAAQGADIPLRPDPATAAQVARRRAAAAVASAEAELARAREMFQRQEYAAAGVGFEHVIEILGTDSSQKADEVRQLALSLAEVSRAAVAEQAVAAAREYRAGDAGVIEPVPLAYLPPKPDPATPPSQLQVLEVHVNSSGTVDAAKFVMNRPSFRNSWWTSAAKAWRFSPALKDGRPVRFVMRIVMDDSAAQR
ncbi:MAG TPA: hypothetical protein VM032_14290 [Vicinamibacterales bacterium]|nr:hypothetical protein [Vicinamibacterales bacterium]